MSCSEIVCGEKVQTVDLDGLLGSEGMLGLSLEPYIDQLNIRLDLQSSDNLQMTGSMLEPNVATFPLYGNRLLDIQDGSSFVLLKEASVYTAFLCLSHRDQHCSLKGIPEGLTFTATSGRSREANETRRSLLCCRGVDRQAVTRALFQEGLRSCGGMGRLLEEKPALPPWLHYLGWETDQLDDQDCNEQRILACLASLVEANIPIRYVVINGPWQQLAPNKQSDDAAPSLLSFQSNLERFSEGLLGLSAKIRKMGVEHIGVTHSMMGHPGGIHPRLAQNYNLPPDPRGHYFLGYDLGHTFQFFYDYYGFLREQGITFIRVADQNSTQQYCRDGMSATNLYKNLQVAMQAAASIQFNNAHFNSECLRNENIFYWTTSRIARCADARDQDDLRSTSRQIRDNLSHSSWLQHLMHADFSPWSTQESCAETMAMFHACSGSLTAIDDVEGGHDWNLLRRLCLPSGKILRADLPITLTDQSLFRDPLNSGKIHLAYTKKNDCYALLLLNLGESPVEEEVVIPEFARGTYALHSSREGFLGFFQPGDRFPSSLEPAGADIITMSPVKNGIAILGCPRFYLLPGPIQHCHSGPDSLHIHSLCTSPVLLTSERQVLEARRNNDVIPWDYDPDKQTLLLDPRCLTAERETFYTVSFEA